jgi:hypothetical protein
MAKKKYQKRKENLEARLESEGLRREAGRIIPISKPSKETESKTEESSTPSEKKVVVPPHVKNAHPKPAKKSYKPKVSISKDRSDNTSYRWWQKAVVFLIAGILVGTGFAATGFGTSGVETLPGEVEVPVVTETPIGEVEVTTEPDPNSSDIPVGEVTITPPTEEPTP